MNQKLEKERERRGWARARWASIRARIREPARPALGTIDFDAQAAALGITAGMTYSMDSFHAERQTDGSNFCVTTNISCFTDVVVR